MDETSSPSSQLDATAKRSGGELKWPRQPYPGLRPFEVDDDIDESLVFFGRDKQKDEILRRLNDSHVVFVVGPSGSGKSSLVKAGVIPALRAGLLTSAGHHWRIAKTRPERRPLAQLAEALAELLTGTDDKVPISERRRAVEDLLRQEDSALWLIADSISERYAAEGHGRMRTLLLIDQFEEAFGPEIEDRAEVDQFFRILTRFFAKPHKDLYLIVAMRTGYIGSTAAHPDIAEMLNGTAYLTPMLTPSQMAVAISRPAETYGGAVEPELVQEILDDAANPREDMADQLPLVQHALFWMWEQAWRGAGLESPPRPTDDPPAIVPPLSLAEFRENDGLKGIMQRHAEELYASAVKGGDSAKRLCELVFKRLCERDLERRYRRTPPTIPELQDLTGASEDELRAVIAPFTASSAALLSVRPQAGSTEDVIDINHESLIRQWDRLRGWADEEAREVATFRELVGNARQWEDSNKDERHLRTGGQLELIETFWKRTNPSDAWAQRYRTINRKRSLADDLPLVEEYVVASRSEEERRQNAKARRRVRDSRNRLISVVGALAVAAVTVGAIGLFQERARQTSVLAAQLGKLAGGDNPIDALLIAESAITQDLSMTPELQGLLQSTVNGFRLETELRGSDLERIAFSPTGNDLLIADAQGDLQMWNGDDQQLSPVEISQRDSDQEQAEQDQVAKRFEWSPDGKFVFISDGSGGGHAAIYEVVSTSEGTSLNEAFPVDKMSRRAQFSPDGALLVTSGFSGTQVELWKLEDGSGRLNRSIRPSSWGLDAAFSSDGRHLALASNGNVDIYEVSKLLNGDYDGTDDVSTSADEEKAATPIGRKAGDRWFELAFHPSDPNMLAIATRSGVGKLWELRQDKELHELGKFFEADDGIRTIAISPDGRWIATSGQDGDTWLAPVSAGWDKETSKAEMLAGRDQIEGLSFSFDSSRLASVSENGVVRIWSIEPRSDESTVDFTRDDWLAALERLKPTVVGPSGDAVPLQLDPKLECLVSPTAAGCAE